MTHGGYRTGSGRGKSGYFRGIYCNSTYELCWVIFSLDHGVGFKRFDHMLEHDGIKYFPDFLLSDNKTIIEIKGYEDREKTLKKKIVAEKMGYTVILLYEADLLHIFDYVKQKYNTKNFCCLYDNYKPKYQYNCSCCNNIFCVDRKRKTVLKFCSRRCSMKYNRNITKNILSNKKISKTLPRKSPRAYKRKYKQIWITNGIINTRIKKDLDLPIGFKYGRIIKDNSTKT